MNCIALYCINCDTRGGRCQFKKALTNGLITHTHTQQTLSEILQSFTTPDKIIEFNCLSDDKTRTVRYYGTKSEIAFTIGSTDSMEVSRLKYIKLDLF